MSNEIAIYEHLKHLQGTVIPWVVSSGPDKWFTGDGMILITEKIGNGLSKRNDGFYMGEERLNEKEVDEVRICALQGLKQIHASNIRHGDVVLRNLRVEKVDGKMHVWWIDFGISTHLVENNPEGDEWEGEELEQLKSELAKYEQDRCIDMFLAQSSE